LPPQHHGSPGDDFEDDRENNAEGRLRIWASALPVISGVIGAVIPYVAGFAARSELLRKGAEVVSISEGAAGLIQVAVYFAFVFLLLGGIAAKWTKAGIAKGNRTVRQRAFISYGTLAGTAAMLFWICFRILGMRYRGIETLTDILILAPHYLYGRLIVGSAIGGVVGWLISKATS